MTSVSSPTSQPVAGLKPLKPLAQTANRDRIALMSLSTLALVGLAVDVSKHNTAETLDSFFTSAHGVLYAAVTG